MKRTRYLTQGAILAALYAALTFAQNLIWPGSATMTVQFRIAECLMVMALYTPAAIPGLTLGCFLFNLTWAQALPLDWLVGSLATLCAAWSMWMLSRKGHPWLALWMPAVWNGPLVGLELALFLGKFTWGVFGFHVLTVFLGEAVVLLTLGSLMVFVIKRRRLERLFR